MHGMDPFDAIDYWRKRAKLAESDTCAARARISELEREVEGARTDSEFWRSGHVVWQEWAAGLLARLGRQIDGGEWGDKPAREIVASAVDQLIKYVEHNNNEYRTMKDVLRAEHQECQRLRAEVEGVRNALADWLDAKARYFVHNRNIGPYSAELAEQIRNGSWQRDAFALRDTIDAATKEKP